MKNDLPKLIRDKIPHIIKESGKDCVFRKATSVEIPNLLFSKLEEECKEFFENPCVMEAADIYEVFLSILENWHMDLTDVVYYANVKRLERGGFQDHLILESVQ